MIKKLIAGLVLAISSACLAYLLLPGGYDVFHGGVIHTFLGMVGLTVLPIASIFSIWYAFFRKNKSSINKGDYRETEYYDDLTKAGDKRKSTYISMLNNLPNEREFKKDIDEIRNQIERFERYISKIHTLYAKLAQKSSLYTKECEQALLGAISLFYGRVDSMMSCIKLFDGDEYRAFCKGELDLKSSQSIREKQCLFEAYFQYTDELTDLNEKMILTLQTHLSDLTKLSLNKEWDNESILAMKRLNDYIKSMKEASEFESKVGEGVMEYFKESSGSTMRMTRK